MPSTNPGSRDSVTADLDRERQTHVGAASGLLHRALIKHCQILERILLSL